VLIAKKVDYISMKTNLLIIGTGQLGSRHLQALANLENKFAITIYDPSPSSIDVAISRYQEVKNSTSPELIISDSIVKLPSEIFTAIIATNSLVRRKVVENLLSKKEVRYLILEKFLFPEVNDYLIIQEILDRKGIKAFVNTPRRMYPFYNELAKKVKQPFHLDVSGVGWGLACNAVHFVDLMSFFSHEAPIQDISFVSDHHIYSSKRNGYVEFCGTLLIRDVNSNTARLTCYNEGSAPMMVHFNDCDQSFAISEFGQTLLEEKKPDENGVFGEKESIFIPRQSQLTHLLVEELQSNGTCSLPEYAVSAKYHIQLLEHFLETYQVLKGDDTIQLCPIT
jgi:hypothetical protein